MSDVLETRVWSHRLQRWLGPPPEFSVFFRLHCAEELVRFLALPYGPNDPAWPANMTPHNEQLLLAWRRIVRDTGPEAEVPSGREET